MKTYREFLNEAVLKGHPFESQYKILLNLIMKLPWDSKPMKKTQSALNSIDGEINGWRVSFSYHKPDSNWGASWAFLSVLVSKKKGSWDFDELMSDDTGMAVSDSHIKLIQKAGLNIRNARAHMKPELHSVPHIKANLKDMENAIKKVAKLT